MKDHHEQHICNACGYIVYGGKKFNEHNRKYNHASCHSEAETHDVVQWAWFKVNQNNAKLLALHLMPG